MEKQVVNSRAELLKTGIRTVQDLRDAIRILPPLKLHIMTALSGSRKGQGMDLNGNVIYAVDFDGTLSFGRFPGVGDPNDNLFRFLKAEQERGARLILYTCRTGDDLAVAVEYCRDHGLEFEFVNENLPEMIELYGTDARKISADFYIDDKAVNPIAGHFTVVPAGFNFKKK